MHAAQPAVARGHGRTGWAAPGEDEPREHFSGEFLAAVPPAALLAQVRQMVPVLR